ncbi:MAG: endonuclease III [Blastocatellia bacterium]|nr:MAG: endonuclease III [Blastocatellia bacterium]
MWPGTRAAVLSTEHRQFTIYNFTVSRAFDPNFEHLRDALSACTLHEVIVKTRLETLEILDKLEAQHPGADTELHHTTAFELLVATILSAQSTDQRVNMVTPALFKRYPSARELARTTAARLEPQIHSTGFFRAKSKALIGMAKALVNRHGGEVPASMDALISLPGVGRKTANVVLGHALGVPGLPVDRHVLRVANRIGIAESEDPTVVEQQLCDALPRDRWTRTSDTLILHGRRVCKPRPLCEQCAVQELCNYFERVLRPIGGKSGAATVGTVSNPTPKSIAQPVKSGRGPRASKSRRGGSDRGSGPASRHKRPRPERGASRKK